MVKKETRKQTLIPAECLDPKILEELAEIDTATGGDLGEARDDVIGPDLSQITSDVPATLFLVDRLLQANRTHTGLEPYREKARSDDEDWTLKDGLVLFKNRLVVPEDDSLKVKLVDEAHKQPSTAHPGKTKTKLLVKAGYYWPKMDEYNDRYVKNCHTFRVEN